MFQGVRIIVRDVSMQILGILNTEANIQIRRKKRFWRRSRQVILGGEPFEPENQKTLVGLLRKVRESYPEKNIWCYTGYLYDEQLLNNSRARCEYTDEMLSMIDVLVDGEFVEALKDIRLVFRGSSNQRVIDVKKSLGQNEIVMWQPKVERGV